MYHVSCKFENEMIIFMNKRVQLEGKGCPRLTQNRIRAIEQLLNAIILNNADNLTKGLNYIYQASKYVSSNNKSTNDFINELCGFVPDSGVYLLNYDEARNYNITTNSHKIYKNLEEKQLVIDKDFQTDKKVIFDGKDIKFNGAYYEFIERICFNNSHNGRHNLNDEFYESAVSKFEDFRGDFKSTIPEDLSRYITRIKKNLRK